MPVFTGDYREMALRNTDYRRVLSTQRHSQLVAMALPSGENIGNEVHNGDQFFLAVHGRCEAVVDDRVVAMEPGTMLIVPAGSWHDVRNSGSGPAKLLTWYSPPEHPDGTVHPTKADARLDGH